MICDLSRRGDINAVVDSLKKYYKDKDEHPWHHLYKDLKKYKGDDLPETLVLLREAIFGALDILTFGLVSEIPTDHVLSLMTDETSWNSGKRKVRNYCIEIADDLITRGDVRYLLSSALVRDDFRFLIPKVEEAQWENFKKARPKTSRGKLDLSKLEKSILGSKFLRDQMIMETKIASDDPRAPALLEAYELQLVDIEVDRSTRIEPPPPTEQVTLNGEVVQEKEEKEYLKKRKPVEKVIPLTDFIEEKTEKVKNKETKRVKRKSGRKKSR